MRGLSATWKIRVDRLIVGAFGALALWHQVGHGVVKGILFTLAVCLAAVDD